MTGQTELKEMLRREPEEYRRHLYFVGMLYTESGAPSPPVVIVGGSAIEVYTRGVYVSGDIDLVVRDTSPYEATLRRWEFKKTGRLWIRAELGLAVDLLHHDYTGSLSKIREAVTPFGTVQLAGVEDVLVKRLASAKHWRIPGDVEHAALLASSFEDSIDWDYVERQAANYEVTDILNDLATRLGIQGRIRGGGTVLRGRNPPSWKAI